ncbi:hypothetical protein C8R46DRAFT_1351293 [Mycena filopes]|nr:hypothetical protein C8R46DRAFT_1351293 [Mycena filopes]
MQPRQSDTLPRIDIGRRNTTARTGGDLSPTRRPCPAPYCHSNIVTASTPSIRDGAVRPNGRPILGLMRAPSPSARKRGGLFPNGSRPYQQLLKLLSASRAASPRPTGSGCTLAPPHLVLVRYHVEQLEEMQRDAETFLAAVTYPVLTLPNEITSRIFSECLLTDDGPERPAPHTAPLLLAQICRHWRDVALSTCELCSSIDLAGPHRDKASALDENWLTRAKLHPLWLQLDSRHLLLIRPISPQLQRLRLSVTAERLEDLRPFPPFPNLQHLTLDILDSETTREGPLADFLKNITCSITLILYTFPVELTPFLASVTSLDILRAGGIGLHTFIHALTHLPLLQSINCCLTDDTSGVIGPPVTVPQLRSLELRNFKHISLAIASLTLPNLNRLELGGTSSIDTVLAFASRSSCRLDNLTAHLNGYTIEESVRCLQAFPFLTTLEVTLGGKKDVNDGFLISLTSTTPTLIPRLQTLLINTTVDPREINGDYYTLLIQMLRRRQVDGLRSFELDLYDGDVDPWDQKGWRPGHWQGNQLLSLIEAGCEVRINYYGRD